MRRQEAQHSPRDVCEMEGCTNRGERGCRKCGAWVCAIHWDYVPYPYYWSDSKQVVCDDHFREHQQAMARLAIERRQAVRSGKLFYFGLALISSLATVATYAYIDDPYWSGIWSGICAVLTVTCVVLMIKW